MGIRQALVAAAFVAAQQQAAQQTPPLFRGGVSFVTIDVTVVDSAGKPITGLSPTDFIVTIEGRRRPVRTADYLLSGSTPDGSAVPSAERARPRNGRTVLLVVDDLSARPKQMTNLLAAARRMLTTLDSGDLVGVATTSGLGPVVNPTADRAPIRAVLDNPEITGRYVESTGIYYVSLPEAIEISRVASHIAGRETQELAQGTSLFARVVNRECLVLFVPANTPAAADQTCTPRVVDAAVQLGRQTHERAQAQLTAYARLLDALRLAAAPRVMIALSQGVVTADERGDTPDLTRVSVAAARSNTQFYALTDIAEYADAGDLSVERATARREENAFLTSGVSTLAEAAGGAAFKVSGGNADASFARILAETAGKYELIVETGQLAPAADVVNVKVAVNRAGALVRANPHATASGASTSAAPAVTTAAPASVEDALQTRIEQGGASDAVPIAVGATRRRTDWPGAVQVGGTLRAPAATAAPVIVFFALVNEQGDIVHEGRQNLERPLAGDDFWSTFAFPVDPGRYRLRVAAADRDGHIGAAEQPVTAELAQVGRFLASDVLFTWTAGDGSSRFLALDVLPQSAGTLRVTLELYPQDTAASDTVRVRFALLSVGTGGPMFEHQFIPARNGDVLTAGADLSVAALEPGSYVIRATIVESGAAIGTVSRTFRKGR